MTNMKGGAQQAKTSDVTAIMLMLGMTAIMILAFWWKAHTQLSTGYAWIRAVEYGIFSGFGYLHQQLGLLFYPVAVLLCMAPFAVPSWRRASAKKPWRGMAAMGALVTVAVIGMTDIFASWAMFLMQSDKSLITFQHWIVSSLWTNGILLLAGIVPFAVWIAMQSSKTNPYNGENGGKHKDYTLDSFSDTMSHAYPHLELFRKLNLPEKPINSGKYRMADTEKQFAISNDLLDEVKPGDFKVNRDRSAELFRRQLGRPWTGFNNLSRYEIAVLGVLLPRIAATDPKMSKEDYKAALETTNTLCAQYWVDAAASYDTETDNLTLNLDAAKASVKKYGKHRQCQMVFNRHAYVYTAIYDLLSTARRLGVLAACDLRWLRVVNRPLWLMIDTVGRIVAFTETAGIHAHYMHELKRNRAIERPMIEPAVKGIVEGVGSYCFSDEELEDIRARQEAKKQPPAPANKDIDLSKIPSRAEPVYLAILPVGAERKDIFAAALIAANGDPIFEARCKPDVEITEEDEALYGIDDGVLDKINERGFASSNMRKKLLELCLGASVEIFTVAESDLIPDLKRAAATVVVTRAEPTFASVAGGPLSLQQAAEKSGHYTAENKAPAIQSAVANAKALRAVSLWVKKASLKSAAPQNASEGD